MDYTLQDYTYFFKNYLLFDFKDEEIVVFEDAKPATKYHFLVVTNEVCTLIINIKLRKYVG